RWPQGRNQRCDSAGAGRPRRGRTLIHEEPPGGATMNNRPIALSVAALVLGLAGATTPAAQPATPFKLGTFQAQGRDFIGLVLRDTVVVDVTAANAQYERANPAAARLQF